MNVVIKNKYHAFTYLETLFTLFLITIIFSILPSLIKTVSIINNQVLNDSDIELAFFSRDFTQDLIDDNATILLKESNEHQISIKNTHKVLSYEFKNNKIIKTVNGRGNITVLNNVIMVHFKIVNNKSVVLNLKKVEKGQIYVKKIIY
ncbi:competence type IV pilus minor pilin ComGF [Staphylococcus caeli]|uniref:Late competence protein ComGF, access of DNA to ComEA n=1 Tax=Staphylococcus caeli TaxID=2201815 RepID=A0A1D4GCV1_9STAP|nr:competence type IV pilus minor pilin ComGF [Staphylococcus caeli]SCS22800.1 Late competence protein ComGF, access of DNA to ComEA [Staphylococcus caeli]SCT12905.1 Late competence protein ComGF, access of DNA to ComEA [Staphylococcus caeli]